MAKAREGIVGLYRTSTPSRLVVVSLVVIVATIVGMIGVSSVGAPVALAAQPTLSVDSTQGLVNDSYYKSDLANQGPTPSNVTTGPIRLGGPSQLSDSMHWWFSNFVADNGYYQTPSAVFYNFTTPEDYRGGDTMFAGVSTWDSYYSYPTVGDYDQEGFAGGSLLVTQTSSPCGSSNGDWCAYFSICQGSAENGYCGGSTTVGFTTWEYGIQPNSQYEDEMTVTTVYSQYGYSTEYAGYVYYLGVPSAPSHQLVDSFTWLTGASITNTRFQVEYENCYSGNCFNTFTDYEEIYSLNSVEPWPMFNIHTSIAFIGASQPDIPWGNYFWMGSGSPTDAPSEFVESYSSGQNYVNMDNELFESWVNIFFGYGWEYLDISNAEGSQFSVSVYIATFADPVSGQYVYYEADYCSLPCGDYGFTVYYPYVEPANEYNYVTALMTISGTVPSPGTYLISEYVYNPSGSGSWAVSEWELTFTN